MRIVLLILDGVGCGDAPDAAQFGDLGSNTLRNLSQLRKLHLPNLQDYGLGNVTKITGVDQIASKGAWGTLTEQSKGKDSTSGHWELAGLITKREFPYFPNGFPKEVLAEITCISGRQVIGNKAASGTEIIKELGEEHVRTGALIVYTSADSVLQIAAHEEVVPLSELYRICRELRSLWLDGEYAVGRIISRPFLGSTGAFFRTPNRHDESLEPESDTILDYLVSHEISTTSIGKVSDLFAGKGFTNKIPSKSNDEGVAATIRWLQSDQTGFAFVNLVDFDQLYGHRNDVEGFATALERFDMQLLQIVQALGPEDVLFITADHGNDPTTPSTDHSRERVPLLIIGERILSGITIGTRSTFADVGASIVDGFGLPVWSSGTSFWKECLAR